MTSNPETPKTNPEREGPYGPDLLVMLPPRSKLFDNVSTSGSQVSELSEPFSDFGATPEIETSRGSGDLSEQDIYSALGFSSEFKTVMDEIKSENSEKDPKLSEISSMMAESYEQIRLGSLLPLTHRKIPLGTQMKIVQLLNDRAFRFSPESSDDESEKKKKEKKGFKALLKNKKAFVPDEKKTWDDIKDEVLAEGKKPEVVEEVKKIKKKEVSRKHLFREEELAYETMSGYWRLLSVYDDFKISPPGYDAYDQDQAHWLQTKPIPLSIFEDSRAKCLEWLQKYFETY